MCVSRIFVSGPNSLFLRWIQVVIHQSFCYPLQIACFLCQITCMGKYPLEIPRPSVVKGEGRCACEAHCAKLLGGVYSNGWGCSDRRETILAQDIYCSKPNPKSDSQSGSWLRKVLGTQALQCIREYNPTTVIATRPLTQPFTCKIGSSIFVAMSLLKVASAFLASNKLRIKN